MESPEVLTFSDDFDSACSTPFVSAPSSPGRTSLTNGGGYGGGFFYSAPASPIHFMISSSSSLSSSSKKGTLSSLPEPSGPFQFGTESESMTSADELFLNGQIRPLQVLSPLLDNDNENGDDVTCDVIRGREQVLGSSNRSKSLRRRARSMSPLRDGSNGFEWLPTDIVNENNNKNDSNKNDNDNDKDKLTEMETTPSGASSRSSSVGRSSKRWVFLKEFLYRSKSEGRTSTSTSTSHGNGNTNNIKFWTSLSFNKDKKLNDENLPTNKGKGKVIADGNVTAKKAVNGVSNRRMGRSAHEVHYTVNRAQAEEMRRKTYLPYKQGLLGCLGFSSKSYGAMNGFARALNPVSSR